jgi:hypothetical protein
LPPVRQQDDVGTICYMQPMETSLRKITQRISC